MTFSNTAYLYVDGESHFEGASKCWAKLHPGLDLGSMCHEILDEQVSDVRFYPKAKFFWYDGLLAILDESGCGREPNVARAVYVTSMVGSEDDRHAAAVYIRKSGFEPLIIPE